MYTFRSGDTVARLPLFNSTTAMLERIFKITQQSMCLTVASTGECLGPTDGKFLLSSFDSSEGFEVHGDVSASSSSSHSSSSSTVLSSRPCLSTSSILADSAFQPVSIPALPNTRRPTYTSSRSRQSVNVHVVSADVFREKKKVEFLEKEQAYLPVSETTANVPSLLAIVREKWGQNVDIVTSNGLPVVDEPGTRGIQWWRCPSRRIYVVDQSQIQRINRMPLASRRKRPRLSMLDSEMDSDGDLPRLSDVMGYGYTSRHRDQPVVVGGDDEPEDGTSRPMVGSGFENASEINVKLEEVLTAINNASAKVDEKTERSNKLESLRDVARQAFRRVCCLEVAQPPVIMHPSCGRIVGCETCTNELVAHGTTDWPLCRGEVTPDNCFIRLNGVSGVIESLKEL